VGGDAEELISLAEAARRFGLSKSHVQLLARTGRLSASRTTGGREWFTTPAAVRSYLANTELRSRDPRKRHRTPGDRVTD
jgi:excisionase family DNA binding protein